MSARADAGTSSVDGPGVYSLNGGWLFGGVYTPGAESPGYDDSGFAAIVLPHTVTSLSWGDWNPSSWEQHWIYRHHLSGAYCDEHRVLVDFAGVMTSATVYLNGTELGTHQGGYLPFSVELTGRLASGDNVLAVVVDGTLQDVPPNNVPGGDAAIDYLQPAGIYRDVALRVVPEVFVADIFASPTDVLTSPGLSLQVTVDAGAVPSAPASLTAILRRGASRVAAASATLTLAAAGTTQHTLQMTGLGPIELWSPESPALYEVEVSVRSGSCRHSATVTTGFREAVFQVDGFYLNGARYEIFGLNRHQLFPYLGMAGPRRLQRRDAELLKDELQCNMVRCSHYPQSEHFLDACDELGLMVWQEPPGWGHVGDTGFRQLVLDDVREMIVRDRSRPSVIVWAVRLNETSSRNNEALYAQTGAIARQHDGTRQTTGAMDEYSLIGFNQQVFAYDDYHSADGNTRATLNPPIGGVPYVVSEAVGALDGAPLYRFVDTTTVLQLQATMHAQVHDIARGDTGYAGLIGWCAFDYASLSGGDRIWHNVKWPGVLDTFRVAKPGAAFYRTQTPAGAGPLILPAFFWDFGPGSPSGGPGPRAVIATNCASLEVTVGDAAPITVTPDTAGYGSLAHPPAFVNLSGIDGSSLPGLRIDGYDAAGSHVATVRMSSDPALDHLSLVVEDPLILADGSDATRFTIRALDEYGNQRPYPSGDVTLGLSGPATLIAENPFSFAEYGGVGGGFIRSQPDATGRVTISATHPTLGRATASLTVVAGTTAVGSPGAGGPPVLGSGAGGQSQRSARAA